MGELRVGGNVDSWCTKCRLELAHTIEAMVESEIKRVKCNTCGGKHQYKSVAKKTPKRASAPKAKESRSAARPKDFERLLVGKDASRATPYDLHKQFCKGALIAHSNFGLGVVVNEIDARKIEVLFESGSKILAQARP